MKIVEISYTIEKIKLKVPFITALREVHYAEFIRLKIICDDGSIAYGEAPSTKAITGETLKSIASAIEMVRVEILEKKLHEAYEIVHKSDCGSSAKAAFDIALVTLFAKEKGLSLWKYFDIDKKLTIKTDITVSLSSVDIMLQSAKEAYTNGMDILKIKLGENISHAIEISKKLSKELPCATLLIDANQAWNKEESFCYLDAIKECENIALIEQPVAADAIEELKEITAYSKFAILADEAVFTLEDAKKVLEMQAADMLNIKVMKCGGITKAVSILEYAKEQGVKCMLGSMIEGPYSINATLYLAFAYSDVISYIDLDSPLLYEKLPKELDFDYKGASIGFKAQ